MTFEQAEWRQALPELEAPAFRRDFYVSCPMKAVIDICGLGFFELYINGEKVTDDRFVPGWTNYEPRLNRRMIYPIHDSMSCRTYYMEYDLSAYVKPGGNCIYILLGNGWYNQHERNAEGDFAYGIPKLAFVMSITEKNGKVTTFHSGDSLKCSGSGITHTNIYFGEDRDLRVDMMSPKFAGFDDSEWMEASRVPAPETVFYEQDFPPDRVIRSISPALVLDDGTRKVYDLKENITGYAVVNCDGRSGEEVTVTYSEEITDDGRLDYESAGGKEQIQTDRYICGNTAECAHPVFVWHGFRYMEITGPGSCVRADVLHTDVKVTADFHSSSPELNWLFETYVRTQLGNYHGCVPSDCPHRERLGYTGDGQLTADTAMYIFDCRKLYEKWMRDIADCQDIAGGHVQHTAPFYGGGGGPGGWGGAVFVVPMTMYRHYGDKKILETYLPNILKWLDYMESRCENGLVVREEKGGWCLGEWCAPEFPPKIPNEFINTYFYIKGMKTALEICDILKVPRNPELEKRLEITENAFVSAFFDDGTGSFCGGVNGADAFGVDLGLGLPRTLKNLAQKYGATGTLDTGIFGTDVVIDVLFRFGYGETAFKLLTNLTDSSFARMKQAGATTLWETWDGKRSHNHPMFGAAVKTLFTYILGIRQEEGSAGFKKYVIKPVKIPGLYAEGHITVGGEVIHSCVGEEYRNA